MVESMVVEQNKLTQTLESWLAASGIEPDVRLELYVLPGEIIIRPHSTDQEELKTWFKDFRRRHDKVLRRLAA